MLKSKVDLVKLVELMEKNDQKKLQLLNYLDQYPNRQVRNSELQDKLQISYYMFKRWTKKSWTILLLFNWMIVLVLK